MPLSPAIADVAAVDPLSSPSHSGVHQDVKDNLQRLIDGAPAVYQVALSGGPTSGATVLTLGTIIVPALDVATIQVPSAYWTGRPDATGANDAWQFAIHDDTSAGAIRGSATVESTGEISGTVRHNFSVPMAQARTTPANTARTYVVTIVRSAGDGTINSNGNVDWATVLVLPDFS